jgi:hypothetical protein
MGGGRHGMSTKRRRGNGNVGAGIPVVALACLLGGCAARSAPPPKTAAGPAPSSRPARLAWLPVEPLASPEIAGVVNDALTRLEVAGATESVRAPVSMEVAQLTIECIEPTVACYSAVGRSFRADRLLWLEMAAGEASAPGLRITLALFDVNRATFVRREAWRFASVAEARRELPASIERAVGAGEPRSSSAIAARTRTP